MLTLFYSNCLGHRAWTGREANGVIGFIASIATVKYEAEEEKGLRNNGLGFPTTLARIRQGVLHGPWVDSAFG